MDNIVIINNIFLVVFSILLRLFSGGGYTYYRKSIENKSTVAIKCEYAERYTDLGVRVNGEG